MSRPDPCDSAQIRADFQAARHSGLRAREAAEAISLSEGAVLGAHAGEHEMPLQTVPLKPDWLTLLKSLQPCGPMMALTRNDSVVHEKTGVYTRVSGEAGIGMVLGRDIDLRLFLAQWHAGFAVMEVGPSPSAPSRRSLQFFNAHGRAIHKVFAREATDLAALEAVISRFADPLATTSFGVEAEPWIAPAGCEGIDAGSFLAQWAQTQDTHEFFGLIRRFGLQRQQAFRLAEGRFAWRLAPVAVSELLHGAARARTPIMVFVGSGGCIQIHTGLVHRIEALQGQGGEWLNVLDPGFNLHLRTDHIAEVWHVEKPTADGLVTSVEVFSARGELMAMFFGERKPGQPELVAWRALVAQLPSLMGLAV